MKKPISLKLFVTLSFLLLGTALVIGYSILSTHYYFMGMSSITASQMEGVARSYIQTVPKAERKPLENIRSYKVAGKWADLPQQLRDEFKGGQADPGLTIKVTKPNRFGPPDEMYFVYRYQGGGEELFVVRHGNKATAPPLIGENAKKSKRLLFIISITIVGVLGGVIVLLLRRVSRPVASLGQWARSLSPEKLSEPPPDFSYPELNELAELMRNSLSSVQESLEREYTFLRHASHELRTPIAVVRNNVELLHKVKESLNTEKNPHLEKAVDRIDRAGLNMQYLTETLLWLSRKDAESLPEKEFQLDSMVEELVEEMQYLLDRKDVELKVETSLHTVCLPEYPVRIVLGNLIRNALQHTWEQTIIIRQQGNQVNILNPQISRGGEQKDVGFGLGLQLTKQLSGKLGWKYEDSSIPDFHQVSITFGEDKTDLVNR